MICFSYILYSVTLDAVKVGSSINPARRVKVISRESRLGDVELIYTVPDGGALENIAFDRYSSHRYEVPLRYRHGGWMEWYALNERQVESLMNIADLLYDIELRKPFGRFK